MCGMCQIFYHKNNNTPAICRLDGNKKLNFVYEFIPIKQFCAMQIESNRFFFCSAENQTFDERY